MRSATKSILQASAIAASIALASGVGNTADAAGTLRIAMTASDVPTTTGMPNNGFEGMRFLGYPVFEGLVIWDLSKDDVLAPIKPGLAESWKQDEGDPKKWTFNLRQGVTFHDGSPFNADAILWNMDRYFDESSPQFETQGSAIARGRNPHIESWRKIDDHTFEITTKRPMSYLPYLLTYLMFSSPAQFEKTGSWAEFAKAPAGTGPFKITGFEPRVSVTLERYDDYWDEDRIPKLDKMILYPMPEATTRLAALRSGQVDWIEVPPPDAVDSIKGAGFEIVTNSYPHIWPWVFNVATEDSPFADVKVRQAANYCVDRDGMVTLLNGLAEPSVGFFKEENPLFGEPENRYAFDPEKSKALLAEAGYGPDKPVKAKIMISTSGSGQMLPLPMNEFLQQSMAQCGFDISFEVVEWGTMLVAFRNEPTATQSLGTDAMNISLVTSDISQMARWFLGSNATPNGSNWGHWKNEAFDEALGRIENSTDPEEVKAGITEAHEILVDEAPWLWIVHDGNPRAMTKNVKGFVSAQSWFQDFTQISMEE